jgi:imidazolonepropionase-like amidohydrolase
MRPEAFGLVLAAIALGAGGSSWGMPHPTKTIYANVTIINPDKASAQPEMAILVEGERITAVEPMAALTDAQRENAVVFAGKGLYALPGLIDSHVHLATDPDRAYAEAELKRELYGGVTGVRDMAGDARMLADLSRASTIGEIPAPDIFYSALMAGPDFFSDPRTASAARGLTPGQEPWLQAVTRETNLPLAVAEARGTFAAGIKIYADLDGDLVRAIIAEAKRQGFPVWTHLQVYPATPYDSLGAESVSHACMLATFVLRPGKIRYDHADDGDFTKLNPTDPEIPRYARALAASGTVLDATLSLYERNPKASRPGRLPGCSRALAAAITRTIARAGAPVSAGTDYPAPANDPFPSLYRELDALVHDADFTPHQAIVAATRNSALAAGVAKDYGALAPGQFADIILVKRNPLEDIDNLRSVVLTVKRGAQYPRADYHFAPIPGAER